MYPDFKIDLYSKELLRPWKLVTFGLALGFYIWGAYFYQLPTWDVPVSIIMSVLTYVFAPFVVKTLFHLYENKPKKWIGQLIVCLLITYGCASGSYEIYHMTIGIGYHPPTYWPNLYYSTLVFLAAGIFWKFDGTARELLCLIWANISEKYKKQPVLFVIVWLTLMIVFVVQFYKSLMLNEF